MESLITSLKSIKLSTFTIIIGVYLLLLGLLYYLIFHKHHKRNNVGFDELITLVAKFYTNTIVCTIIIFLGMAAFFEAYNCKYERDLVFGFILLGIAIISGTIIYYIKYIKKALEDYDEVERQEYHLYVLKVGEVIEFIIFIFFAIVPLLDIHTYIDVFSNKQELMKILFRDFGICLSALFLLYVLNPLDVLHGFKRIKVEHEANIKTKEKMKKDYEKILEDADNDYKEEKDKIVSLEKDKDEEE